MPLWAQRRWDVVELSCGRLWAWIVRRAARVPVWAAVLLSIAVGAAAGAWWLKVRRDAADVAVVVNGEPVTGRDLYHRLEIARGEQALEGLIENRLMIEYAQDQGISVPPADLESRTQKLLADPQVATNMQARHLNDDDIRDSVRNRILYERLFANTVPVTEAEIRAMYRRQTDPNNPSAALIQPQTLAVHLLGGKSETDIRGAWADLRSGTSFETIAQKRTTGPNPIKMQVIPRLARSRATGAVESALETALFRLKSGELLPPTYYHDAWWIARCDEIHPAQTPSFEAVKEQCKLSVQAEKARQSGKLQGALDEYRAKASLKIYWPRYKGLSGRATAAKDP
jgi:hypothetical protein